MKAAVQARQRPVGAKLLVVGGRGALSARPRAVWRELLSRGDVLVANDAATLPASLPGRHEPSGLPVELRLAARASLRPQAVREFTAVLFGAGDWRTRTEDRPAPPPVRAGDRLLLGEEGRLAATVEAVLGHPRLLQVGFDAPPDHVWTTLARQGRPVQYAHLREPLALWDVWTRIAAAPVAFEPPSAGFALDWEGLSRLHERGVAFATLTHAAGLSSTGDAALDRRLPLPEPYHVPATTARAVARARSRGGRVVAVGTTVVRALEDSAWRHGEVRAGEAVATLRLGPAHRLQVVDVLLSGTHEPDSSHYELLRAFAPAALLERMSTELEARGFRTHEFGDSVWMERQAAGEEAPAEGAPVDGAVTAGP